MASTLLLLPVRHLDDFVGDGGARGRGAGLRVLRRFIMVVPENLVGIVPVGFPFLVCVQLMIIHSCRFSPSRYLYVDIFDSNNT